MRATSTEPKTYQNRIQRNRPMKSPVYITASTKKTRLATSAMISAGLMAMAT
jgi:hypothetical protein